MQGRGSDGRLGVAEPAGDLGIMAIVALVALAFLPKMVMILAAGAHVGGDSHVYAKVAANIYQHFCVSLSPPEGGACAPHWGGNQLPGYPAFIALVWLVFGRSVDAVLIAQSLVFAVAATRLAAALVALGFRGPWPWLTVLLLGVSPSLIGWSRSLLTETLTAAAALWLLSELLLSWRQGRLRIIPTALAFTAGVFLRYDFVLLALPVAVAGFTIHRPGDALRRGIAIALITTVPLGAWTMRSISLGLPTLPPLGLTVQGEELPKGMMAWLGTWVDDQYQLRWTLWMVIHSKYDRMVLPEEAYSNEAERGRIEKQLSRLSADYLGQLPPAAIDDVFAAEAARRITERPLERWVLLPLRRTARMWLSPFASMGWPAEVSDFERDAVIGGYRDRDWPLLIDAVDRNAGAVAMKIIVALDRYALIIGALLLTAMAWRRRQGQVVFLTTMILAALVARALFSGYVLLLETRYLVPQLAWFDVALVVAVASMLRPGPQVPGACKP